MTPLARKAAHLTRAAHSLVRRMDYLTAEIERLETWERAEQEWITQHGGTADDLRHIFSCTPEPEPLPWPNDPEAEGQRN